jgi:hypothetical protein
MPSSESIASSFFSLLAADKKAGFRTLRSLVKSGNPHRESEWIEYKSGFYGDIEKDIGPEWSKQLSGFANAGDGLIIWGLQTKTINKYDVPAAVVLVKDAEKLAGELERIKQYAVEPHIQNVSILSLSNRKGEGFVVAFVPESSRKPHQVKFNNSSVYDRYYIRNGHSTEPIRHSLLRMLFYPQSNPQLHLSYMNVGKTGDSVTAHFHLRNIGAASASELDAVITDQGNAVYYVTGRDDFSEYRRTRDAIGVLAKRTLHPEFSVYLGMSVLRPDHHFMVNVFGKDMKPFRWRVVRNSAGDYEIANAS